MRPKHAVILVILLTLVVPDILRAQDSANQQTPEQVAYIRFIQGEVGYQRGDDNQAQWSAAVINTPLMTGDFLYANERGRAEIQLGDGNFLRLGKQGYIGLLQSDDRTFQFKLASGTATLRLQRLDRNYEIDAPNLAFSVERAGEYRLDVGAGGETRITLHKGRGAASIANRGEYELKSPARLDVANGSADFIITKKFKRDDWDRWNWRRDFLAYNARPQYLPPGVYGYETMSGYGRWVQSPAYGLVWMPTMGASWQPYRLGRWVWVDPFGWTWVSYEPWGWAPYHYGRWVYIERGWAWVPGPPTVRQRFAAALVAFLNGNEGGEWVGWFPLGPGEPYQPYVTRDVYVVRPVRQYVNYNYVTVVNRTEIYNSTTAIYNTRIVSQQVIENTQVLTQCNIVPSHETLYSPPVRITGDQVVTVSNTAQPAPRPTEEVIQRDVRVRTAEVPTVRKFDEKLGEIQRTGVVRPVSPFQPPPQPVVTASPGRGNSANGAQVAKEKPNPPGHDESHGRRAGTPPGLAGKVVPAANSPATGQVSAPPATTIAPQAHVPAGPEDQRRPHYQPPADLEPRVGRPANTAPVQEQARPKYGPPQEVERRMSPPGTHGPGGEQPKPVIPTGPINERRGEESRPVVAPPRDQARPAYQPPQEVDRRMNPPGTHGPGGEQPKSVIPTGPINERRSEESRPVVAPPRDQARPAYQPPASAIPGRESKPGSQPPQPAEGHANRPESGPAEVRKPTQLPSAFPVAVRPQQSTPTQSMDTATPHQAPRATVPAQAGNGLPNAHNDRPQPPKVAPPPLPPPQTQQPKQADPPRPSSSEPQQKGADDKGKDKDKNKK